jgi:hypothetical protein
MTNEDRVLFTLNSLRKAKVNQAYCMEILKRLRESVGRERPELWPIEWILHHDNAPAHKALSIKQFVAQKFTIEM